MTGEKHTGNWALVVEAVMSAEIATIEAPAVTAGEAVRLKYGTPLAVVVTWKRADEKGTTKGSVDIFDLYTRPVASGAEIELED